VHAWIFRHRHGLRAVYGLPPEERLAPLLEAGTAQPKARATKVDGGRKERVNEVADAHDEATERVRQLTLRPWRRPA
jgi:hypothetical protein